MLQPNQIALLQTLAARLSTREVTQMEASEATGVHQSQISRILSGKVRRASPNVLKLCKYAETLTARTPKRTDTAEIIFQHLGGLVGESPTEDLALLEVARSLAKWRQTWGGGR